MNTQRFLSQFRWNTAERIINKELEKVMYRVMLVDDEPLILAGITSMLDWEANNYKIVGKAANGADALSQMAELQPDIVIADIKMPAMDGITLMKRAKEAGYPSVFILLTNLEEFSLAREAMKLEAVAYLVKLELSEEALTEALSRASRQFDRSMEKGGNIAWGGTAVPGEEIRNYFKHILVYNTTAETDLQTEEMIFKKFRKPILLFLNFNYVYTGFSETFTREDHEKTMEFAENIIGGMVRGFFRENCLLRRGQNDFAVVVSSAGIENWEQEIIVMGKKIQSVMRDYFEVSVTIASSQRGETPEDLQELLYEAMSAMNHSFYEKNGSIIFYSEKCEQSSRHSDNFDIRFMKKDIMQRISQNDSAGFVELMNQIILLFEENMPSKMQALNACHNLYYFITSQLEERGIADFPYAVGIAGQLNRMDDLDTILKWLSDFRDAVEHALEEYKTHRTDRNVEFARKFVEEHYREKISLNQVALLLGVSVGHLSSSFKRQTGKNFLDYVTEYKVEKAKELMESGDGYMVYEIADMLGFETSFYFSRVFKKVTGMSPRDYERIKSTKGKHIE